jgi:hypothetical protein
MTQRMHARPAGLGRAEAIVMGGLCLLVVAVVASWLGGGDQTPATATPVIPATQPLEVLEPVPLMTEKSQIASADGGPATLPATSPAGDWEGGPILLPID